MDNKYYWIIGIGVLLVAGLAVWFGTSSGQAWLAVKTPVTNNMTQSAPANVQVAVVGESYGSDEETTPASCTPGWICDSATLRGYLSSDCQLRNVSTCKYGCVNGSCTVPPVCTVGYKCKDANTSAYQTTNCQWNYVTACPYGCANGTCIAASTCASGYKCQSSSVKGYQNSNCQWTNTTTCQYGCTNGECNTCGTLGKACCSGTICTGANLICKSGKCQNRYI